MDFLLWATRSIHIFAVVVWLGGLMYQSAVTLAIARADGSEFAHHTIHALGRFIPFVWMCVWTVLVTGLAMMLFSTKYVFLEYHDRWSVLLLLKQVLFAMMAIFSLGFARMFSLVEEMVKQGGHPVGDIMPYYHRMVQFGKINVGLGIATLLFAAGMK